jgi:hypothetical protein
VGELPLAELAAKTAGWGSTVSNSRRGGSLRRRPRAREGRLRQAPAHRLEEHGLSCWAISCHLADQAVCDRIDARDKPYLRSQIWGDGDPEGVRRRAAERVKDTARAAGPGTHLCSSGVTDAGNENRKPARGRGPDRGGGDRPVARRRGRHGAGTLIVGLVVVTAELRFLFWARGSQR